MTAQERQIIRDYLYSHDFDTLQGGYNHDSKFIVESVRAGGLNFEVAVLRDGWCYSRSDGNTVIPEEYFGIKVDAALVDYHGCTNSSAYCGTVTIPDSIEVVVVKGCSDKLQFALEHPDKHPVFILSDGSLVEKETGCLIFHNHPFLEPDLKGLKSIGKYIVSSDRHRLVIPDNIERIMPEALQGSVQILDITGRNTVLDKGAFRSLEVSDEVRINRPLREVAHILGEFRYDRRNQRDPKITLKAPELDTVPSINPGFFRVTRTDNDAVTEVNIINIAYYSPIRVERYDGMMTGTRIVFNAFDCERGMTLDVYESPEAVAEKIRESLGRLSENAGSLVMLATRMAESIRSKKER